MQQISLQPDFGNAGALFGAHRYGVTSHAVRGLSGFGVVEGQPTNPVSQVLDSIFGGAKNALDSITGAGASGKAAEESRKAAEAMAYARQAEASATGRLYDALPKVALGIGGLVAAGVVLAVILKR